ncbi:MAG: hypothetical protein GXO27_06255 [Chlorobi bacterium]|nr:hypothetical protein [Chlorobiota bacterium]
MRRFSPWLWIAWLFWSGCGEETKNYNPRYIDQAAYILRIHEDTAFFRKHTGYLTGRLFDRSDLVLFRKYPFGKEAAYHFFDRGNGLRLAVTFAPGRPALPAADTLNYQGELLLKSRVGDKDYFHFYRKDYGVLTSDRLLAEHLMRNLPDLFLSDSLARTYDGYANPDASAHWLVFPARVPREARYLTAHEYLHKHSGDVWVLDVENPGDYAYTGMAVTEPDGRSLAEVWESVMSYEAVLPPLPPETREFTALTFDDFARFYKAWTDFKTYTGYRQDPLPLKRWKSLKGIWQGDVLVTFFDPQPKELRERLQPAFTAGDYQIFLTPDSATAGNVFYPLLRRRTYKYVWPLDEGWIWTSDRAVMERLVRLWDAKTDGRKPAWARLTGSERLTHQLTRMEPGRFFASDHLEGNKTVIHFAALKKEGEAVASGGWKEIARFDGGSVQLEPRWVYNHLSGKYELVYQDAQNRIVLVTAKGKRRWAKDAGGPVLGEIRQVDMYKNGKRQFVFATPSGIYVADIHGKYVAPFPLHLRVEAPLAVFDYEGNKNYRLMAASDGYLKVFDLKGREVKGFKPLKYDRPPADAPRHIRIGTKDYILVWFPDGTLRILNRRGKDRIRVKEKIPVRTPWFRYGNTFAAIDTSGRLVRIDVKGRITRKEGPAGPVTDAAFTPGHRLEISGGKVFLDGRDTGLPPGDYMRPRLYEEGGKVYFTVVDRTGQTVYAGTPRDAAPLAGDFDASLLVKPRYLYVVTRYRPSEIIIYGKPR